MWSRVFEIHISDTKPFTFVHVGLLVYTLQFDFQVRPGSTSSLATLSSLSQAGAQDLATPTPCALLWCLERNLMNCKPHIFSHENSCSSSKQDIQVPKIDLWCCSHALNSHQTHVMSRRSF